MGYCKIKVHLRIKPSARPSAALHIDAAKSIVRIDQRHHEGGPPKHCSEQHVFPMDNIIQSTSQEAVFEQCAKKMVEEVLSGYNGTLMAYGQSGSGKTFTMTGEFKNPAYQGIIPRAIHQIFAEKTLKPEAEITVHVSYLEIYNEIVYDLLNGRQNVQTMEDNGIIDLRGLSQIACSTEEEALKIYLKGDRNRSVASQPYNKISNRSHSMFTIYVERHARTKGLQGKTVAKLNMVDLAAFERIRNSDPMRPFQKDSMAINKSLTFLEQAVSELRKDQLHVCFRQSRLTLLLRDALGGNSKTEMIICAYPEDEFLDETVREIYSLFKEEYLALQDELDKYHLDSQENLVIDEEPTTTNVIDDDDCVGELDGQGFHVGEAPADARPVKLDASPLSSEKNLHEKSCKDLQNPSYLWQADQETKNKAFTEFKHGTLEGLQHNSFVKRKRQELREMNQLRQQLREKLKTAREEIQEALCHSGKEKQPMVDENTEPDMDKRELIERLQRAKATYQKSINELVPLNTTIENIQQELKDCQQNLLESFFQWYDEKCK